MPARAMLKADPAVGPGVLRSAFYVRVRRTRVCVRRYWNENEEPNVERRTLERRGHPTASRGTRAGTHDVASRASKRRRTSSASPRCLIVASSAVLALPSWRYGRRTRRPHSAGVRISSGVAGACGIPSPVPMSCSNRSEKSATGLRSKSGFARGARHQYRDVAQRAANGAEHLLTCRDPTIDRAARRRGKKTEKRLEVVDRRQMGPRVGHVFRVRNRIAEVKPVGGHASSEFVREQLVGDPHFVTVGIGAEGSQGRVLTFPSEPAERAAARWRGRRPPPQPTDVIAVAIVRICRASSVSSAIASTSPAPNVGMGIRRAITFASGGRSAGSRASGSKIAGTGCRVALHPGRGACGSFRRLRGGQPALQQPGSRLPPPERCGSRRSWCH